MSELIERFDALVESHRKTMLAAHDQIVAQAASLSAKDAQIATLTTQLAEARGEPARIVAWLRGDTVPGHSDEGGCPFDKAANLIEQGAYRND